LVAVVAEICREDVFKNAETANRHLGPLRVRILSEYTQVIRELMKQPEIIQGGMGIGVSHWGLAREVSLAGQLGVVAGTAVATLLIRRLQQGDPAGHMRRALAKFPYPHTAERILDRYFVEGGKPKDSPYELNSLYTLKPSTALQELTVLAGFTEVLLAKEGHEGVVGINLLEKLQLSNLAVLYGAMLAGVDYVLMGAGIPREIPGVLDQFSRQEKASLKVTLAPHSHDVTLTIEFDPAAIFPRKLEGEIKRPRFLAIVSSAVLAQHLLSKSNGAVNGFVVEGHTAGGHNAPPRGRLQLNELGEPVYTAKDQLDFDAMNRLGVPYWLAGGFGSPEGMQEATSRGAAGIQVGTPFAFCEESGLTDEIKKTVVSQWTAARDEHVFTDPVASPTGFPFKVVPLPGTLSEKPLYDARERKCDLGYLRQVLRKENGSIVYVCPAEPEANYAGKGGDVNDCQGRKCLCNALLSNVGLGQHQENGYDELPLLTAGDDLSGLNRYVKNGDNSYTARQVIAYILATPL